MFQTFNTLPTAKKPAALAQIIVNNPEFHDCHSQREIMEIIRDNGGRFDKNNMPKVRAILHAWFNNGNEHVPPFAHATPDEAKVRGQSAMQERNADLHQLKHEADEAMPDEWKARNVHPAIEGIIEKVLKFLGTNVNLGAERVTLLERTLWSGVSNHQKTIGTPADCILMAADAWGRGNVLLDYPRALEVHREEHDQRIQKIKINGGVFHKRGVSIDSETLEAAINFLSVCEMPTSYVRSKAPMTVTTKWGEI